MSLFYWSFSSDIMAVKALSVKDAFYHSASTLCKSASVLADDESDALLHHRFEKTVTNLKQHEA